MLSTTHVIRNDNEDDIRTMNDDDRDDSEGDDDDHNDDDDEGEKYDDDNNAEDDDEGEKAAAVPAGAASASDAAPGEAADPPKHRGRGAVRVGSKGELKPLTGTAGFGSGFHEALFDDFEVGTAVRGPPGSFEALCSSLRPRLTCPRTPALAARHRELLATAPASQLRRLLAPLASR